MRTAADWQRLGSDARKEDGEYAAIGFTELVVCPIGNDPREALAGYYADELADPKICDDPAKALDALTLGYSGTVR